MTEKIKGGSYLNLYLGDTHREALDKIGKAIAEKPTTRGLKSKAVRYLIENYKEKK